MKKSILIFVLFSFVSSIYPQASKVWDDAPANVKSRKYFKRMEWFFRQRALPNDTISLTKLNMEFAKEKAKILLDKSKTLQWLPIGPKGIVQYFPSHWGVSSGRSRALDIHPTNPNIVYMGAAGGGIWKTTDGGESWISVSDNFNSISFGAIAIDPNNPEVVYAGTGEAWASQNQFIYYGDGLYKTTNGGGSWAKIGASLNSRTHFADIVVNPNNSNYVYASLAAGNSFNFIPEKTGVWTSTNGGLTWVNTLVTPRAFDIECHPTNENMVYAAVGGGNENSGFYISSNKGLTWVKSNSGLPASSNISRMQISLCKESPQIIYGYLFNFEPGTISKVFKSTNGGVNWSEVSSSNPLGGYHASSSWYDQGNYDLCIAVKPDDPNSVMVGNIELHKTTTGNNFGVMRMSGYNDLWGTPIHCDYHNIVYSKSNPQIVYIACDGGIYKSIDAGNTWINKNNGISTIQFYSIASHPQDRNILVGGAQDNGNSITRDRGNTNWDFCSTGDGMSCFFDYVNPNIVYISTQEGMLMKSTNGGLTNSFSYIPPLYPAGEIKHWNTPFFMHPTNHNKLYVITNRIWTSTTGGNGWTASTTEFPASITSAAQNVLFPEIMVFSAGGNYQTQTPVLVSTNEGVTWGNITNNIPGPANFISNVKTDPLKRKTIYIVRSGFGSGKIYKSENLGLSWTNISGNLPDIPHSDLFIDPEIPGYLYTANDFGVYQTTNGGVNWNRINNGMPIVPVIDFDYVKYGNVRLLRAATHGRSAFELELPNADFAFVNITTPQGEETVAEGDRLLIKWLKNNVSGVNIYLSKDNKVSWQLMAENYPADSLQYNMLIPAGVSNSCFVKIEDKFSPLTYNINSIAFSITAFIAPQVIRPLNGNVCYPNDPTVFEWTPVLGANYYSVDVSTDSLFTNYVYQNGSILSTPHEVTGLENNKKYFWKVSSGNEIFPNLYSGIMNFITQLAKPVLIAPLNNSINVPTPVNISWSVSESADKYHLQICKNIFFNNNVINDSLLTNNYYQAAGLELNKIYYWRVRSGNQNGYSKYAQYYKFQTWPFVSVNEDQSGIPNEFALMNNYPNPFNPGTTIKYQIPVSCKVVLEVYSITGEKVTTLVDEVQNAGYYNVDFNISSLSSGIYMYKIQAGNFSTIKKMMILK
ncbi:MAG: T9SS type A sorting domain-containing protein [bacterium]